MDIIFFASMDRELLLANPSPFFAKNIISCLLAVHITLPDDINICGVIPHFASCHDIKLFFRIVSNGVSICVNFSFWDDAKQIILSSSVKFSTLKSFILFVLFSVVYVFLIIVIGHAKL